MSTRSVKNMWLTIVVGVLVAVGWLLTDPLGSAQSAEASGQAGVRECFDVVVSPKARTNIVGCTDDRHHALVLQSGHVLCRCPGSQLRVSEVCR